MGAYNSKPVTECISVDEEHGKIQYGASSMQGWRRTQEDAHNCCPAFDEETQSMLFAVYDGHGGSEVAEYCALRFPDFIKKMPDFKEDHSIEEALCKAFIDFDATLTEDSVVNELRLLAKRLESPVPGGVLGLAKQHNFDDDSEDDLDEAAPADEDETAGLLEDACMPVEQVLRRLTNGETTSSPKTTEGDDVGPSGSASVNTKANGDASSSKMDNDVAKASSSPAGSSSADKGSSSGSGGSGSQSGASSSARAAKPTGPLTADDSSEEEEDSEADYTGEADSDDEEESENEEELAEFRKGQELALKFTESDEYLEVPGSDSGCTACVTLIRGNKLYCANAGDSRCVLSRGGKAVDMSLDHKPEDDTEKQRIDKAGGFVTPDGRVNGNLNLSRALGDHNYKRNKELELKEQMITPLPDVKVEHLTSEDEFIIIACDGIWNSVSSQECIDFVKERLEQGSKLSKICEDLFHSVLADDAGEGDGTGCDNMTCIIIDLKKGSRAFAKNQRTSSTGFDHTISDIDAFPDAAKRPLPNSPDKESSTKKAKRE